MAIEAAAAAETVEPRAAEAPLERSARGAWGVVAFLTIAASLSTVDRQVLALMIGPIRRDLAISDAEIGLLGGLAFTLLYTFATLPMAWIADRGSRRAVISAGMLFWSAMTAACGLTHRFASLFLARMGVGLGEAALSPAAFSMMSDLFPRRSLPMAIGLFSSAPFIGVGAASILGGALVQHLEAAGPLTLPVIGSVRSWQILFLCLGVPGVLLAILGRLTLPEPARRGLAAGGAAPLDLRQVAAFFWARRGFLGLMFTAYVCLSIQGWCLFFWVVEFLFRERGVPRAGAGLLYGVLAFALGLAGSIVSGRLGASLQARGRVDATMRLVLLCVLALGPLAVAMPFAPRVWQVWTLLGAMTFLMGWPSGLGTSALQFIVPNELKGRIIAIYLLVVNFISLTLGPWLGGLISDRLFDGRSLGGSLALMAAVNYPVAAVCLALCLRPFRRAMNEAEAWRAD